MSKNIGAKDENKKEAYSQEGKTAFFVGLRNDQAMTFSELAAKKGIKKGNNPE